MKKIVLILTIMICLFVTNSHAHKNWVHFHLAMESCKFLLNDIGSLPQIEDYLGIQDLYNYPRYNQERFPFLYSTDGNFAYGAWLEDQYDPKWQYSIWSGWSEAITHFWQGDNRDFDKNIDFPSWPYVYENAFDKAYRYMFGRDDDAHCSTKHNTVYYDLGTVQEKSNWYASSNREYHYNSLFGLVNDDLWFKRLILTWGGQKDVSRWLELPLDKRLADAFIILGRIAHLLCDNSIPIHVHIRPHVCNIYQGDKYEIWSGNNGDQYDDCDYIRYSDFPAILRTAITSRRTGGLLNEVFSMPDDQAFFYMFYQLNQLTDHFSNWFDQTNFPLRNGGNINLPKGATPFLTAKYNELGAPENEYSDTHINQQADILMNYYIRTQATLLYWFCIRAGLVPCPNEIYLQNDIFYGIPSVLNSSPINNRPKFSAVEKVIVGKNVNPHLSDALSQGNYTIKNTAKAELIASKEILLKDGSLLENGCDVHIVPNTSGCDVYRSYQCLNSSPIIQKPINKEKSNQLMEESTVYDMIDINIHDPNYIYHDTIADTVIARPFHEINFHLREGQSMPYPDQVFSPDSTLWTYMDTVRIFEYPDTIPSMVLISDSSFYFQLKVRDTTAVIYRSDYKAIILPSRGNTDWVKSYPNPSQSLVELEYKVEKEGRVRISVYDNSGNFIKDIVNNPKHPPGTFKAKHDASCLTEGSYFYRLISPSGRTTAKAIISR
ncbi:MAG: T9SS type A sorting domain-containing protein [Candidatus Kapabacteria bacterium]|nr:T9SS type A sorting domain-containing protein [Candidatus Kapabacteria bacterium]